MYPNFNQGAYIHDDCFRGRGWCLRVRSDHLSNIYPITLLSPHSHSMLLQCFDAVGWVAGRASGLLKLSCGVLTWLSVWSELQTCIWPSWCHCHSLSLASVKSRLVLPFWYRLTRVVPDKGPLNVVCVCVRACVRACVRVFHSRLKTFLFCKSFPPSFSSSGLTPRIPRTVYRYFWA